MKKLVIVESPTKSNTIKQYLGKDFEVLSSKGHIRDLAITNVGGLGLDIENDFAPIYTVLKDKTPIVKELKKAVSKADEIYLATDPDREGEAISWHLKEVLDLKDKPYYRVIFNEITKSAVQAALENPRHIDDGLVSSQETRRILDRIIGFKLSKLLQNKIKSKSAGRVQSVALKLLVEREKEIKAFVSEEYWKVKAHFEGFEAELNKVDGKKPNLLNEAMTQALLDRFTGPFKIDQFEQKVRSRSSRPPFITSTLQQEASSKLNMGGQRTMIVAQKLYEGIKLEKETVGLITYMRTDSTRLSQAFVQPAMAHIEQTYGKEYLGKPHQKTSKNAQDAHEAIRPTHLEYTPDKLKNELGRDEYRLYKMIYERALASLMAPAQFRGSTLLLSQAGVEFKATTSELIFDGHLKVYQDDDKDTFVPLPDLAIDSSIQAKLIEPSQHFTQPPPRYTEAKLIKTMEEIGIGRPSTYATIIATLKKRNYVDFEDKKFVPTEQGILTVEQLEQFFDKFIDVQYTAQMEETLDDIAQAKSEQISVIRSFYDEFIPLVDEANQNMEKVAPKLTGEACPQCGSPMVFRESRYGTFEACSGYPECKYIKQDQTKEKPTTTGVTCHVCKKGEIVERMAKKGRNKGNVFYACNNFPKCKTILRGKPTGATCEGCDQPMVTLNTGEVVCNDPEACQEKQ